ncbi:MAG: hydroxymethylglutaryl-CoA synthase family protein [Deltaproteobacteria bacterium]|jgi:hydroxymethylglutaryl-CoA synthase|nr:hydroxymethylglutaryl-CoA synthase family protein [Deltaproteobacteria bacterium]MBW2536577.1 hydroxymethylglutaryl-CoA synthase family protein [Deltaproteobacteria bacterium]
MATAQGRRRVGIEKIWAYPCQLALNLSDLAEARGIERDYPPKDLLVQERAVNPCWEDAATMAVNAAKPMLTEEDLARIELLIVGTESSPDAGKPISTFVYRFLGIQENCRNFETKHACYGGTSGLMMAAHWVASGVSPGGKALVICTDQGRMHLGARHEYVLGAGAVALLISEQPDVLELELEHNGYWTQEVGDTFRPTSKHEAGNTENSVYCYLDALEGAFTHFQKKAGDVGFDRYFKNNLYHVPFCAMAYRAHRTLLRTEGRIRRADAEKNFERKVKPGLTYNARVGGTYTGSTFFSLCGLIDHATELEPGDRIGIFAYGSGSCAEYYSAIVGEKAKEIVGRIGLGKLLDGRRSLTVDEYEAIEKERTSYIDEETYEVPLDGVPGLYESHYKDKGLLVLRGLKGYFRDYQWS